MNRKTRQQRREPLPKITAHAGPALHFAPKIEGSVGKKMAILMVREYASFLFSFNSVGEIELAYKFGAGAVWATPKMKALIIKGIELCDVKKSAIEGWVRVIAYRSPDGEIEEAARKKLAGE